ncbi:hypothetical protein [Methyloversatilis sp.]|uniref:hypothetical protein n=1 Tax=Methyloversatilis sp. TaxID=2569862 RepID=UPI0027352C0B|nr:hypothetical protein [Methyloversatilis sp.]MDP2867774.1 hypothetical protein [Methyloversatilis sp.]MDP3454147.1 hypothetical protein [Methyloversatilis sp.]MDP3578313.1 hypothetical protein [Methyloversatilis sp.]
MKHTAVAGLFFAGMGAFSSTCVARMPGTDEPSVTAKTAQVALAEPATSVHKPTPNETLIHLHRAVTGIHFLPPAFSETAVRCCEPSRASR